MDHQNPLTLRKGEKIYVISTRNGNQALEGKVCVITRGSKQGNYVVKIDEPGETRQWNVYSSQPGDVFVIADRKKRAEYCRKRAKCLTQQAADMLKEAKLLEMYESDEEEVAAKISMLMNTKGDVKAMTEILRTLKQSNYI